jgi:hypothetical protein
MGMNDDDDDDDDDDDETARLGEQIWQQGKWAVEMVTLAPRRRENCIVEDGAPCFGAAETRFADRDPL